MATIKSYTDIEQSKKLAEILPLESADMEWINGDGLGEPFPFVGRTNDEEGLPCWSLTALLDFLPKGTNISIPKPINELGYCCRNQYDEIYADNPVDACYKMILKLKEQNLL